MEKCLLCKPDDLSFDPENSVKTRGAGAFLKHWQIFRTFQLTSLAEMMSDSFYKRPCVKMKDESQEIVSNPVSHRWPG